MKKAPLVLSIVFTFLFLICLYIGFVMPSHYEKPTEYNTVQLMATITSIEVVNRGYKINTQEYRKSLNVAKQDIDIGEITDFVGQIAIFRIEQIWANQLDEMVIMPPIVALNIQGKDIITLESYNKRLDDSFTKGKITTAVFGVIFLLLTGICFIKMKQR
ncbi:MAG: hypothetical protein FWH51_03520 [Dehalococcoidia bacterium]|nr:hypothetical protein [Dehalococcoidia bacterium]